jgi:hypothetical protein
MSFLVLRAYLLLVHFDLYLARGNFAALWNRVQQFPIARRKPATTSVSEVCSAMDEACVWYWKEALCLQRSAATVCLLKASGIDAQLVIGTQQMPFRAHAWVEVNARVANDRSYVRDVYSVLHPQPK